VQFVEVPQVTWTDGPTDGVNDVHLRYDQIPFVGGLNVTTVEGVPE
jgi:hypothetical protein